MCARRGAFRYSGRQARADGGLRTAVCKDCGEPKPIDEFYRDNSGDDELQGRRRRSSICRACSIARHVRTLRIRDWNWAAALVKAKAMQVAAAGLTWPGSIDKSVVEAIARIQQLRCAVTGAMLELPKNLSIGQTLDGWADANGVIQDDRKRFPELVRVDSTGEWAPGNIAVAIRAAAQLSDLYSSIPALRAALRTACSNDISFPTIETIMAQRVADDAAFQKEIQEIWHEKEG